MLNLYWTECSGYLAELCAKYHGVEVPNSYASILLHKPVTLLCEGSWYRRLVGGKTQEKIIYAFPNQEAYYQMLQEYSLYEKEGVKSIHESLDIITPICLNTTPMPALTKFIQYHPNEVSVKIMVGNDFNTYISKLILSKTRNSHILSGLLSGLTPGQVDGKDILVVGDPLYHQESVDKARIKLNTNYTPKRVTIMKSCIG